MIAIAAKPRWIEIPRDELFRRKVALGNLTAKLQNRDKPILNDDDVALLEGLWQLLNDVLD